jgi:hypothetical protein
VQIGRVIFNLILDVHECGRKARRFPILGNDQGNWLTVESDLVVVEWTKWRAARRNLVMVAFVGTRHLWSVLMREHVDNAFDHERPTCVDARNAAPGNR